ncbi:MAG: phage baseplate assembly protein V [Rhodoblastus sp.]
MRSQRSAQYKSGVVTLLDPAKRRVRVKFEDEDGVQSFWLRVVSRGAKGMRQTHMPAIGEQVACLVDWRGEDGIILGSVYSDEDPSPTGAEDVDHVTYSDGTVEEHDPKTKVSRLLLPDGKRIVGVKDTLMQISKDGIVVTKPIVLGAVEKPPLRSK